eukprot:8067826-Pyramimonas_sp.AAC.1
MCKGFADGGRVVFKMWFSPWRREHSFQLPNVQELSGLRAVRFRNVVLLLRRAHSSLQELHGLTAGGVQFVSLALAPRTFGEQRLQDPHISRAARFQNVALALAPRALVFHIRKSLAD